MENKCTCSNCQKIKDLETQLSDKAKVCDFQHEFIKRLEAPKDPKKCKDFEGCDKKIYVTGDKGGDYIRACPCIGFEERKTK